MKNIIERFFLWIEYIKWLSYKANNKGRMTLREWDRFSTVYEELFGKETND